MALTDSLATRLLDVLEQKQYTFVDAEARAKAVAVVCSIVSACSDTEAVASKLEDSLATMEDDDGSTEWKRVRSSLPHGFDHISMG